MWFSESSNPLSRRVDTAAKVRLVTKSWKSTDNENSKVTATNLNIKIGYSWRVSFLWIKLPWGISSHPRWCIVGLLLCLSHWSWWGQECWSYYYTWYQNIREVRKFKSRPHLESPLQKTASTDLISQENRIAGKSADTAWKKSSIQRTFFLLNINDLVGFGYEHF